MNDPRYNEDMDDFYKNFLHDYKAEPDEFVWEAIESQIATPSSKNWGYWPFMGILFLGIGIAFMSQSFLNIDTKETSQTISDIQIKAPFIENTDIQIAHSNDVSMEQISEATSKSLHKASNSLESNKATMPFSKAKNKASILSKTETSNPNILLKETIEGFNQQNTSIDTKLEQPFINQNPSINTDLDKTNKTIIKQDDSYKLIPIQAINEQIKNIELPIFNSLKDLPVLIKEQNKTSYSIGIVAGIGKGTWTSSNGNNEENSIDLKTKASQRNIGFFIGKTLNSKWNIQAGLQIQDWTKPLLAQGSLTETNIAIGENLKQYDIELFSNNHQYLLQSKGMRFNANIPSKGQITFEANQELRYATIPVSVKHTFLQKGKFNLQAGIGLNANFLLENKLQLLDFQTEGYYLNGFELTGDDGLNDFFIGGSASLSANYLFAPKWSIQASSLWTRNLSTISSNTTYKTHFQYNQIKTGIVFRF